MLKTLKELCALPGASGREDKVREYIIEKAQPFDLIGKKKEG